MYTINPKLSNNHQSNNQKEECNVQHDNDSLKSSENVEQQRDILEEVKRILGRD